VFKLLQLIYYIPFELNSKYSGFNLQVNDYINISYFQKDKSFISLTRDSSFKLDTGKKLTAMVFLFPPELEIKDRKIQVNLKVVNENTSEEFLSEQTVEITTNLPILIIKSRLVAYEIVKQSYNFVVLFYYMHGPMDKEGLTC